MKTPITSLWACSAVAFAAPSVCGVRDYGANATITGRGTIEGQGSGDSTRNVALKGNDPGYGRQAVNGAEGLGGEIKVQ
jgi:hypothetical protein